MVLQVRLFAVLRERAGRDSLEIEVPEGATVAVALRAIGEESEPLAAALAAMPGGMPATRASVETAATLSAGDELALTPPVSGGAESTTGDGAAEAPRPH